MDLQHSLFSTKGAILFTIGIGGAISIMALTPQDHPSTWHELKDTPEIIDKQLLENTLKALIQYLEDLDTKQ